MALILAVNPGGTQSGTLARIARELKGHEVIGADSCAVALAALDDHTPALVLLPAASPAGEPELLNRLRAMARGGVPTLKLPQPTSVNPQVLADQIRQLLGEQPAEASPAENPPPATKTSAHVITAAAAAIEWIRAHRATWPGAEAAPAVSGGSTKPDPPYVPKVVDPPYVPRVPDPPYVHSGQDQADAPAGGGSLMAWLPRVAALGAGAAVLGAAIAYLPQLYAGLTSATTKPQTTTAPAARTDPAPARGRASTAAAAGAAASRLSGWIAVFSPFEVRVSEGARVISLDDRSRAMLPPGQHTLVFENRALGYQETRDVQVKSTETTTLNLIPQTKITVTASEPAEVLIDGTSAGATPLNGHRVDLGTHTVVVKSASAERQITVTATSKPVEVDIDFSKP